MSGDPARPPSLRRNGLPERAGGIESPLFGIIQIREDEIGLRYPPSLVIPLKYGAGPNCKQILIVSRRDRKTVLVWKSGFICRGHLTATALPGYAPNRCSRAQQSAYRTHEC
jgi:hypothetical protein